MPENLKVLRNRIRSIKQTKKITRAMEMVSAAKLRRTEQVMKSSRPFMGKIEHLLRQLSRSTGAEEHPLFQESDTGAPVLVAFTSDRGLCGSFNANVLKQIEARIKSGPGLRVYVIGRKGRDWMRRYYPGRIDKEMIDLGGRVDGEATDKIADDLLNGFHDGRYSKVDLLYTSFVSVTNHKPVVPRYLPLDASAFSISEEEERHPIDYILEPSPERVFDTVLPRYLKSKIFLAMAESMTSEHAARRMAMNNATKNSDDLSEKLTLRLNKARQAAITTEISEIVGGAEALNG